MDTQRAGAADPCYLKENLWLTNDWWCIVDWGVKGGGDMRVLIRSTVVEVAW